MNRAPYYVSEINRCPTLLSEFHKELSRFIDFHPQILLPPRATRVICNAMTLIKGAFRAGFDSMANLAFRQAMERVSFDKSAELEMFQL